MDVVLTEELGHGAVAGQRQTDIDGQIGGDWVEPEIHLKTNR